SVLLYGHGLLNRWLSSHHQKLSKQIDPAFLNALPEELRDEVNVLADMELSEIGVNMDGCMQSRYVLGKKL
ncbi:helicase and polymerase-containing protein TEBICHI, partial [Tanacetum coccineum]